jgi:hypothetical protein
VVENHQRIGGGNAKSVVFSMIYSLASWLQCYMRRMNMKIKLLAGLVLAAGTMLAGGPHIAVGIGIGAPAYYPAPVYSYYAPPPPVYLAPPPIPAPGYAWVGGSWIYSGGYRTWRPGYWAAPHGYVGRGYVAPRGGAYYRGGYHR